MTSDELNELRDDFDRGRKSMSAIGVCNLLAHIERQAAEIERLQAIVSCLPTTADGQTVTPGMLVYGGWEGTGVIGSIRALDLMLQVAQPGGLFWRSTREIYSTRKAAEAAIAEAAGGER